MTSFNAKVKKNVTNIEFQAISWHFEDAYDRVNIYISGALEETPEKKHTSVMIIVDDYQPYAYIHLDDKIKWNASKINILCDYLEDLTKEGKRTPITEFEDVKLKTIYESIEIRCLKIRTMLFRDLDKIRRKISSQLEIPDLGPVNLALYESNKCFDPIMKFSAERKLLMAGWLKADGIRRENDADEKRSRKVSTSDIELLCHWGDVSTIEVQKPVVSNPKILSIDTEEYSNIHWRFPDAENVECPVIAAPMSFRLNSDKDIVVHLPYYSKTVTVPAISPAKFQNVTSVILYRCKTEADLILKIRDVITSLNPDIIIGYNHTGFDYKYIMKRAELEINGVLDEFMKLSKITGKQCKEVTKNWSSSGAGNMSGFLYPNMPGRMNIDLLPLIRQGYSKIKEYSLNAVSMYFLKETKIDLPYHVQFANYKYSQSKLADLRQLPENKGRTDEEIKETMRDKLRELLEYSIQDTILPLRLWDKLVTFIDLTETSNVRNRPLDSTFMDGQQIKTLACILRKCMARGYVINMKPSTYGNDEDNDEDDEESYLGALCLDPAKGRHENVPCFDFSSLYPTIIQANNICYSTLIKSQEPKEGTYNVIEWEEHVGCKHDVSDDNETKKKKVKNVVCCKKRHLWRTDFVGIIPEIVDDLISSRNKVKALIKTIIDKVTLYPLPGQEVYYKILDRRQNAFKIANNSMYGGLGAHKGYLPCPPGAECVTAFGRQCLIKVCGYLRREGCQVLYGDTDSCFFNPPGNSPAEKYKRSWELLKEVNAMFPKPIKMEFEKFCKIFLITQKKNYSYVEGNENGEFKRDKDGGIVVNDKGIVTVRREISNVAKTILETVRKGIIFNTITLSEILVYVTEAFVNMITNYFVVDPGKDQTNKASDKAFDGDNNNNAKPSVKVANFKKLTHIDFLITKGLGKENYKNVKSQVQAFVADDMKKDGKDVKVGDRLQFVYVEKKFQYLAEKAIYAEKFLNERESKYVGRILLPGMRIDFIHYMERQVMKPLDKLLAEVFKTKKIAARERKSLKKEMATLLRDEDEYEQEEVAKMWVRGNVFTLDNTIQSIVTLFTIKRTLMNDIRKLRNASVKITK
jgi:DNA polymerase delta subunit 1